MNKLNKFLFMAVLVTALTGCGVAQQQAGFCGGDFEQACTTIFGFPEDKSTDERQDEALNQLQEQVNSLNSTININIIQIESLYRGILMLQSTQNTLDLELQHLTVLLNSLQSTVNIQTTQLAQLSTGERVTAVLDCNGDNPGFDEVVLRLSSGKLLAYFESGGNRFLSVLTPGNYRTTDSAHGCPFTVNSSGQFCDSWAGCR